MADIEAGLDNIEAAVRDVEQVAGEIATVVRSVESTAKNVETAIGKLETAVNEKWSTLQGICVLLIFVFGVLPWLGEMLHSKWLYAMRYGVETDQVIVDDEPHDCAFLAAPLGEKYCHYESTVSVVRWATSQAGSPIISYDDGKTWNQFTPDPSAVVPKTSTVQVVRISWEKKNE
jgi:hypothetical protein